MTEKNPSYIGVTGFGTRDEVLQTIAAVPTKQRRKLGVGVLVDSRTFSGDRRIKFPVRYPKLDDVEDIFVKDSRVLNIIHLYNENTDPTTLGDLMNLTANKAGKYLSGFQINNPWPLIYELTRHKEHYPKHFLILQVGLEAMQQTNGSMEQFRDRLRPYLGVVNSILIDGSGRKGVPLNPTLCLRYLQAIRKESQTVGIGVKGGLHSGSLSCLSKIVSEFPDLSISVEEELRDENDNLLLGRAKDFVRSAYEKFPPPNTRPVQ